MKRILFWMRNARSIALPQSILPALLAIVISAKYALFYWPLAVVALLGIVCAHLGMNLADDYFDYKVKSADNRNHVLSQGMRARIGKYPYLTSGEATVGQLGIVIFCFLALAGLFGVIVVFFRGWPVVVYALIGLILGVEYSGKPLQLAYHGLGELVIGLMFGPLLMLGMQCASQGGGSVEMILISIAVGLLVTNIIFAHSILDEHADEQDGKMTFARLLDNKYAKLFFVYIFALIPFVIVLFGVLTQLLEWWYLLSFLTLPMAIYLVYSLQSFILDKKISYRPKFWMGPMTRWKGICEAGIDWFMIRWLVARNLVTFFCLILIVCNLVVAICRTPL